jgi:hypothetical protein
MREQRPEHNGRVPPAWDRPVSVRARGVVIGVAGVALCAWCGWVSGFHRTSAAAEITWCVTLATVLLVDLALWRGQAGRPVGWHLEPVPDPWPRIDRGGPGPAVRGVAPWLVLIGIALAWDGLGIDTGPRQYHLTISALAQAYRPLNAALLLVWVLVGIGYEAARVRAPVNTMAVRKDARDPHTPEDGSALAATVVAAGGHHTALALLLPSSPPVGVAFWVAVPVAAVLIDVAARRSDGRVANAEEFVRFISTSRLAHVALAVAWGFAGYHLFAR